MAVSPQEENCASWLEDAGSSIAETRLQGIAIPLDPAKQVLRNQVDGVGLRSSSEVVVDHVLAKVAVPATTAANNKRWKTQRGRRSTSGEEQRSRQRSIAVDVRDFVGCIGQHTRDQEVSALAVRASECAGGLPRKVVGFGNGSELNVDGSVIA